MEHLIKEHLEVVEKLIRKIPIIDSIADIIIETYRDGGKILVMGNGGSACDAEHFVGELVSRFKFDRKGLPAINLASSNGILTAIGNDYDYKSVFSRQVVAQANHGDVVIGLSTSGTSANVIEGLKKAKELDCIPILITGNKVANGDFLTLNIDSGDTARIQEAYLLAIHMICEKVEHELFA